MKNLDPATEIEKLRQEIRRHDRLYYVEAKPEISDLEYDRLMNRLKQLEAEHPNLVTPESPTQRVGEVPITDFEKVEHLEPMLSIDNTYTEAELRAFDERVHKALGHNKYHYVVELKVDGVACSLIYERGLFARGVTRGNGRIGDDITQNLRTIRDIPLQLETKNPPELIEIRGEVYMTNSDLADLNARLAAEGSQQLANPRNTAAGALKLKDAKKVAQRPLRFFAHSTGAYQGPALKTHEEFLGLVAGYGLVPTPHVKVLKSIDEAVEHCNAWWEAAEELDFEIDGLVLKINDLQQRQELGATTKAPRWVIAYKVEKYEAPTKLDGVTVQVGKSGVLKPVAKLDPVQIAGTTVTRASLHNYDQVELLDVRLGDTVIVEKAGKIIPHVVRVEKHLRTGDEQPLEVPTHCPSCESVVEKDADGVEWRCLNPNCPAQIRERIEYFVSRVGMDIRTLAQSKIEQLLEAKLVTSIPDLYRLQVGDLTGLERWGKRSAENLIKGLEESKSRDLHRLLCALSIRHVGPRVAEILAQNFRTLDNLMSQSEEDLVAIEEIGPVIAQSVRTFFEKPESQELVKDLKELGLNTSTTLPKPLTAHAAKEAGLKLAGKTLVVTGTLNKYSRKQIQDLIKQHGGKASSSVSKKTDYLVAGAEAGSKLEKAEELGIAVLSEDEFEALLAEETPEPA